MPLPIHIDKVNGIPIYIQLGEQLRLLMRRGVLKVGDAMPTARALAVQLQINANTVARVYRELQTERLLRLQRGIGTFVAEATAKPLTQRDFKELEKKACDLIRISKRAGMSATELSQFIETRWTEVHHASR